MSGIATGMGLSTPHLSLRRRSECSRQVSIQEDGAGDADEGGAGGSTHSSAGNLAPPAATGSSYYTTPSTPGGGRGGGHASNGTPHAVDAADVHARIDQLSRYVLKRKDTIIFN